jgi:hypothetical protein
VFGNCLKVCWQIIFLSKLLVDTGVETLPEELLNISEFIPDVLSFSILSRGTIFNVLALLLPSMPELPDDNFAHFTH